MPLVPTILQNEFLRVFKSTKNNTADSVARDLAGAYESYAQWASAGGIAFPAFTGLERLKLEKTLLAVMSFPKTSTSVATATALANGVMAFWQAPPVIFGPATPGVVTMAAGVAPAILAPAIPLLSNPSNPTELVALSLATIVDAATRTVLVTLTLPPPASPIVVPLV